MAPVDIAKLPLVAFVHHEALRSGRPAASNPHHAAKARLILKHPPDAPALDAISTQQRLQCLREFFHISPLDKGLGFIQGLLCGAEKLNQIACLLRDPVVPEIMGVKRIASQSVLSRFFAGFDLAAANAQCFGALWQWCIARLKPRTGGYSLDLSWCDQNRTGLCDQNRKSEGLGKKGWRAKRVDAACSCRCGG